MTEKAYHARNLTQLYKIMLQRHGADHALTRRALADARHAGADLTGIDPVTGFDYYGMRIPEQDIRQHRDETGVAIGHTSVLREDLAETIDRIRLQAAAQKVTR